MDGTLTVVVAEVKNKELKPSFRTYYIILLIYWPISRSHVHNTVVHTDKKKLVEPSTKIGLATAATANRMKVLLTGGSGFIAAHCLDVLLEHGFVYPSAGCS